MAYKISSVERSRIPGSGSGPVELVDGNHLIVRIFNDVDGVSTTIELYESDYAGLIAEFEAGVATTIMEAAVAAEFSGPVADPRLSATQESWRGTYVPTE